MLLYEWDIMSKRVEKFRAARPLSGHRLFVIQHVLDDLTHLISAFIDLGCAAQDITVVGIPYSSRQNAGDVIAGMGCQVVLPAVFPMDGIVGKLLLESVSKGVAETKPLIILEDGGYAVPQLSQLAKAGLVSLDCVKGAVEQTTRGKWLAQRVQRDGYLALPVISIPDCGTKQNAEPKYIAQAVVKNLSDLLNHVDAGRRVEAFGMYGCGTIGNYVAEHFRANGARVYVADIMPERRYRTTMAGFLKLDNDTIGQCDLILGATGSTSIGPQPILSLKHGALIGSTSSRQIEIDMEYLHNHATMSEPLGPRAPAVLPISAGRRCTLAQSHASKVVTVLYDGYPINFWGTSLPDHVADAVLSLLLEGVLALATDQYHPGVHPGGTVLEDADIEISQMFQQIEVRLGFKN